MKNKILPVILSVAFTFGGVSFAQDAAQIKLNKNVYSENGITISGTVEPASERTLTFKVMLPGKDSDDLSGIYRMKEFKSSEDGSFSIEIIPESNDISGEYDFYVGGREYTAVDGAYYFYSSAEKKQFTDELNLKNNAEETAEFINANRGVLLSLGCDLERFDVLQENYKTNIMTFLAGKNDLQPNTFSDVFNKMTGLQFFNGLSEITDSEEYYRIFEENAELLEISAGKKSNAEILGKEKLVSILKGLFANGKTYNTPEELIKVYNETTVVEIFNTVLWSGMENALEINADYLGINLDYGAYDSEKESVYHALAKHKYSSSSEIANVFNEAKKNLGKKTTGGSSGSSGSGSGSGKSNNMSIPVIKTDVDAASFISQIKDIDSAPWAKAAITALEEKNIVSGDENKLYNPNSNITREQFVHMIALAFGFVDSDAVTVFDDVSENAWYKASVMGAYNAGVVSGTDSGIFGTGIEITRQDMAAMLYRAINKKNIKLSEKRGSADFSDSGSISEYADEAVNFLYACEIVNGMGDGSFSPKEKATKAQAAVMINAVLKDSEV